jgi:hypothetical protein
MDAEQSAPMSLIYDLLVRERKRIHDTAAGPGTLGQKIEATFAYGVAIGLMTAYPKVDLLPMFKFCASLVDAEEALSRADD